MAEVQMDNIGDELRKRYPSNSTKVQEEHKRQARNENARDHTNDEVLEPIVAGEQLTKKEQSVARKVQDILFGTDTKRVVEHVFLDILLPGARDTFFDMVTGGLSMKLYGRDRGYGRRIRDYGSYEMEKRDYSSVSRGRSYETRPLSSPQKVRRDAPGVYDVAYSTHGQAYEVLDRLMAQIRVRGFVTVAQLYQLSSIRTSPTDFDWGWADLSAARVHESNGRYILMLPDPIPAYTNEPPF